MDLDALYGFNTVTYPDSTIIDGKVFCELFPFHVVFDRELVIKQCGSKLQRMSGGLCKVDGSRWVGSYWEKPYSSFVGQKCWVEQFFTPNSSKLLVLG